MDEKAIDQLDDDQRRAVEASPSKALKIIAGPGTGKTHTMIKRFMTLSKICPPNQILALTFTNKAAEEMLLRLESEGLERQNMWVSTFHSFATRILRESPFGVGLDIGFRIIEENEQELLLRQCITKLKMESKELIEEIDSLQPEFIDKLWNELPAIVKRIKLHLLRPEDFVQRSKELAEKIFNQIGTQADEKALESGIVSLVNSYYRIYQAELEKMNALDFSDLLLKLYTLLKDESYQERCRRRFRYILVDEFQDTNIAQYKILELIAQLRMANVSVVGDGKQSIYGFRDADMTNLTSRFPPATEVLLRVNYRSFQPILDISGQLISRHYPKPIEEIKASLGTGKDTSITLFVAENREDEAEFIARKIRELLGRPLRSRNKTLGRKKGDPIDFGDFAVLLRAMKGTRSVKLIEDAFNRWQIPYRIIGGAAFLGSQEVIDIVNYLKVVENPVDDMSMVAVLYNPCLGITDYQLYLLKRQQLDSSPYNNYLYNYLAASEKLVTVFPSEVLNRLGELYDFLNRMIDLKERVSLASLVSSVIEESGYLRCIKSEDSYRIHLGLANLQRLHRLAKEFDDRQIFCTLKDFVDYIDMIRQLGLDERDIELAPTEEAVSLMTIHKAKGLEFPVVFMTDFPPKKQKTRKSRNLYFDEDYGLLVKGKRDEEHARFQHFMEAKKPVQKDLAEEARVKYVGLTRAQELLFLTTIDSDNPDLPWLREFCNQNYPLAQELEMPEKPPLKGAVVQEPKKPLEDKEREIITRRIDNLVKLELETSRPPAASSQLRLSYSQLAVYIHCPLQYYFKYVLRIPQLDEQLEGGTIPSQREEYSELNIRGISWGVFVHRTLSQYHSTPPPSSSEERLRRLKEIVELLLAGEGRGGRLPAQMEKILQNYALHPYSAIEPTYIDQEFNLKMELKQGVKMYLRGFIDRIDRANVGWKIIDYKTDAKITSEKRRKYRFQLLTYLLGLRQGALMPEIKPDDKVELEILPMPKGEVIPFSYTEDDLRSVEEKIINTAGKIGSNEFALTEEHNERDCRSCSFGGDFGFCPYNRSKGEEEENP